MDAKQILFMLIQSGVIGAGVMPPLISFVTRVAWPTHVKALVALASSVLVGAAMAWVEGSLTDLGTTGKLQLAAACALAVAASAEKAYQQFWKNSTLADQIEMRWNVGSLAGLARDALERVAAVNKKVELPPSE